MHPIAILTDFGLRDWYVASMKGVLLTIAPRSPIVDISHQIAPQNIRQANFILRQCYREYPQGTVFLAVVDPGVGTDRTPIAIHAGGYTFVGPDNGLFAFLWADSTSRIEIRRISNPYFTKELPSHTFHGRDIFAPVAAHLADGREFEKVGPLFSNPTELTELAPEFSTEKVKGHVSFVDHYGNIITNISERDWKQHYASATAVIYKKRAFPLSKTYAQVADGGMTAYFGSGGFLEIAINGGSAAQILELCPGDKLKLSPYHSVLG